MLCRFLPSRSSLISHQCQRYSTTLLSQSKLTKLEYFQRLTSSLPIEIKQTSDAGFGVFATESLSPGDVVFVERAFVTLPDVAAESEPVIAACSVCRVPQHRTTVHDNVSTNWIASDVERLQQHVERELHVSAFESARCDSCSDVYCSDACRQEAVALHGHKLSDKLKQLTKLRELYQRSSDANAERALLAFAVLQRVLAANYAAHQFSAELFLGDALELMCHDELEERRSEVAVEQQKAFLIAPVDTTYIDFVNFLIKGALEELFQSNSFQSSIGVRDGLITLHDLHILFVRLASVVRLNAFRLVNTLLEINLSHTALQQPDELPPDNAIEAMPRDALKFSGLFSSLACFLNHACIGNVVPINTLLPGASAAPTDVRRRGDEFAFVVHSRPVSRGEELLFEYTGVFDHVSPDARREYLKQRYGFQCQCVRCQLGQ